jgi:XTP/dITP diphosphohydrolase
VEVIFATGNQHKAQEVRDLLGAKFQILTLKDIHYLEDIPETGQTLQDNALIKAQTIFDKFQKPVFADDTGLEVEALDGQPGVFSARFAGENASYRDNCDLLLQRLGNNTNRKAAFTTVFCYINAAGTAHYFTGTVPGNITTEFHGDLGFGYDPIFQPTGFTRTFAEMSPEEKNAISHRARALAGLKAFFLEPNIQNR